MSRVFQYLSIVFTLAFFGCGGAQVQVNEFSGGAERFPESVAVLPFSVDSEAPEDQRPHRLLREMFFNHFSYLGYTDLPLKDVDKKLADAGYPDADAIDKLTAAELRNILGVDAVVRGRLLDANNFTGGIYSETRIKARLEMLDLNTGETLWETEHHEYTTSGLTTLTLVDMVQDQLDNAKVREAYSNIAEMFCLKVLDKIPDPARYRAEHLKLPSIKIFHANVENPGSLKPYEIVRVFMTGSTGLQASFDLGARQTGIAMEEKTPGYYSGRYQIKPADQLDGVQIIGRLANPEGVSSRAIYRRNGLKTSEISNKESKDDETIPAEIF